MLQTWERRETGHCRMKPDSSLMSDVLPDSLFSSQGNASILPLNQPRIFYPSRMLCPTRTNRRNKFATAATDWSKLRYLTWASQWNCMLSRQSRHVFGKGLLSHQSRCATSTKMLPCERGYVLLIDTQTWKLHDQFIFTYTTRLRKQLNPGIILRTVIRYDSNECRPHHDRDSVLIENQFYEHYCISTLSAKSRPIASELQVAKLMRENSKIVWNYAVLPRVTPARHI